MIDMQLLNDTLVALAVLVSAAITFSIAFVAVAALSGRGKARRGGSGGTRPDLPRHPVPETHDARTLVLH